MECEPGGVKEAGLPGAGQALDAGGLGGRQPDRGDAGRAWLPGGDGKRCPADMELQVSGGYGALARGGRGACRGVRGGGQGDGAGERGADGDRPELGEGGQDGVPADRVPGAGLGLVPAEGVFPRFESLFNRPPLMPVKRKSSLAWRPLSGRY